ARATTHFQVDLGQTTVVAGVPITAVTVTARKGAGVGAQGPIDTAYQGTIHFTSTDPNATLPADSNAFVNGVATFTVANSNPGTRREAGVITVKVTEVQRGASINGSKNILVTPASVAGFHFGALATEAVQLNKPQSFVLSAVDAFGNLTPSF